TPTAARWPCAARSRILPPNSGLPTKRFTARWQSLNAAAKSKGRRERSRSRGLAMEASQSLRGRAAHALSPSHRERVDRAQCEPGEGLQTLVGYNPSPAPPSPGTPSLWGGGKGQPNPARGVRRGKVE